MNPNMAQSLSWDHIREARQQATAARRTLGVLAEVNYAQRRMYEIMTDPKGE